VIYERSEVFTAVIVKGAIFWDVMRCHIPEDGILQKVMSGFDQIISNTMYLHMAV
jgi:hypothetical protein